MYNSASWQLANSRTQWLGGRCILYRPLLFVTVNFSRSHNHNLSKLYEFLLFKFSLPRNVPEKGQDSSCASASNFYPLSSASLIIMMRLRRHNVADNTPAESSPPSTNLRRSTRLSKLDRIVPVRVTKPNDRKPRRKMSQAESTASEPRRNAKRKAALSPQVPDVPNNLLEEALKPLDSAEIEDWGGWIELESEPVSVDTSQLARVLLTLRPGIF